MSKKNEKQRLSPNFELIGQIDGYVGTLLADSASDSVAARAEILGAVTKWIGVRHKLQDAEGEDGSALAGYRDAITKGASAERAAAKSGRAAAAHAAILDSEHIGEDLAALRDGLPDANAVGALDDFEDIGRKVHSVVGGGRGLHIGLPGLCLPRRDEDDGDGDL